MKKILLALLVIILLIVGVFSYLGVMPIISPLIAQPKDLGIVTDPALVTAFDAQYEMKNELPDGKVPSDREPVYEGSKELDLVLNGSEISSIIEYWQNQYHGTPIRDVQVRINADGTGEVSGILELKTAISMAKQLGYSDSDITKGQSYVRYVAGDLPFYVKGTGGVKNNQVSINASEIQIGRVNLPSSIADPVAAATADMVERRMNQVPGVDIQELSLKNGEVKLVGSIPDTIK